VSESEALVDQGQGEFALCGSLTREGIAAIWARGVEKFAGLPRVDVDLSRVAICDSAGVAMLVDWLRIARSNGQDLRFRDAPRQLLAIARVSDLMPVLESPASKDEVG